MENIKDARDGTNKTDNMYKHVVRPFQNKTGQRLQENQDYDDRKHEL